MRSFLMPTLACWLPIAFTVPATAQAPATEVAKPNPTDETLRKNTYPFSMSDDKLDGPGAELLMQAAHNAQFVLIGEYHDDRDVPAFAGALLGMLRARYGFSYLAVEQDPIGMDLIARPQIQGDVGRIAALSAKYPTLMGFSTDQDLRLLAMASRYGSPRRPAVWGIEQVQGAIVYLEELSRITPDRRRRRMVDAFAAKARMIQPVRNSPEWFLYRADIADELVQLEKAYAPKPRSRAAAIFTAMRRSADIYSYIRRSKAGENTRLASNVLREELFRDNFMAAYRHAVATDKRQPKVLFKMGEYHLYRGRSPTGAFTIGNFVHEFAAVNGSKALGVTVLPLGGEVTWETTPSFIKPLLPRSAPTSPIIIDLRPIRETAGYYVKQLGSETDRNDLLRTIHGYDFYVVLPNSARGTWKLTGFPPL